jgi:alkanesulfonate monooxygenase SsuD/methylene tetrahydromethanopterin reductase-like flavin-dependent oxidoreductase (luciferase family)
MDEWIAILRECWSGRTQARRSEFYDLPEGALCLPAPSAIPLLIGGHSPAALRRASRNDGWLAQQDADKLDPSALAFDGRVVLRIVGSLGREELVAKRLEEFEVDEVVVDVPIEDAERVREVYG